MVLSSVLLLVARPLTHAGLHFVGAASEAAGEDGTCCGGGKPSLETGQPSGELSVGAPKWAPVKGWFPETVPRGQKRGLGHGDEVPHPG